MRNPFMFFVELARQPIWIPTWVAALMIVNLVSAAFWHEPLAKVILLVFMISAAAMMGIYYKFGFEKVLGLGHVLWLPLLFFAVAAMPGAGSGFRLYLVVWSIFTVVSLVFDTVDVWKYFSGNHRSSG